MGGVGLIGLDPAKTVFQAQGAGADGSGVVRRKLARGQRLEVFGRRPACVVAMEACAGAHFWGRAIGDLGHEVRLIPPAWVEPRVEAAEERHGGCRGHRRGFKLVARRSNDPGDRWAARMVATDHAAQGGDERGEPGGGDGASDPRPAGPAAHADDLRARRAHLAERGIVAPAGPAHVGRLAAVVEGG